MRVIISKIEKRDVWYNFKRFLINQEVEIDSKHTPLINSNKIFLDFHTSKVNFVKGSDQLSIKPEKSIFFNKVNLRKVR